METEIWTVRRVLESIEKYLAQHGDAKARVSSQWLVAEALEISRMQLFLDADRPLTEDERATLRQWTRRRSNGEPLQYITGETTFRHVTIKVRPGVLIPRPETEVLVSEALALLPPAPKPQDTLDTDLIRHYIELGGTIEYDSSSDTCAPDTCATNACANELPSLLVADIGTGSGCIACSIATEHPLTRIIATDISPKAVALAQENVSRLKLDECIDVIECDLGEGIHSSLEGMFNLVVSNMPYVPSALLATIPSEVTHYEPLLALDGGADGLHLFRRLLSWCTSALKSGGAFAFELHETCLETAASEAEAVGFTNIRIVNDLAERPRVLIGTLNKVTC